MISPDQIRKKAENWYPDFLKSFFSSISCFPKIVPSDKKSSGDNLIDLNRELEPLLRESKDVLGYGYKVELRTIETRRNGSQSLPERILFETETDYLRFLNKEEEFDQFKENVWLLQNEIPALEGWIQLNPLKIIQNEKKWPDLIKVCNYFINNPKPNLYIRELPIQIHTKFIEQNKGILRSLLDYLIPHHVNPNESDFEKHFNLKYDQPLIRLNILDEEIANKYFSGIKDISIPQNVFEHLHLPINFVVILENKTNFSNIYNFLTLPHLQKGVAIFGQGFGAGKLANVHWLKEKTFFYWGDIDTHGYLILNQIRKYFPAVISFLMDKDTLMKYKTDWGKGEVTSQENPEHLLTEERELYNYLKENNVRLEQEKIRHEDVVAYFKQRLEIK